MYKNVIEILVRCTVYDLIHFAVFVLIELCVMLCEYLIKKWRSSQLAVSAQYKRTLVYLA